MLNESKLTDILVALQSEIDRACLDAERRGYERGASDAKSEILALLQGGNVPKARHSHEPSLLAESEPLDLGGAISPASDSGDFSAGDRKRAPRGLPSAFTDRVLRSRPQGSTTKDILAAASSDLERMIKDSTIRGELRKGRESGRYEERNSLWYIIGAGGVDNEAED